MKPLVAISGWLFAVALITGTLDLKGEVERENERLQTKVERLTFTG